MKLLTITLAGLLTTATVASAQGNCAPYPELVERLSGEQYAESVQIRGLYPGGQGIIEVFANDSTGTWTIVTTNINGIACVRADGIGFERTDNAPEPTGMTL